MIFDNMFIHLRNLKQRQHTMTFGIQPKFKWKRKEKCTDFSGCIGPKKSSSGQNLRKKPWKLHFTWTIITTWMAMMPMALLDAIGPSLVLTIGNSLNEMFMARSGTYFFFAYLGMSPFSLYMYFYGIKPDYNQGSSIDNYFLLVSWKNSWIFVHNLKLKRAKMSLWVFPPFLNIRVYHFWRENSNIIQTKKAWFFLDLYFPAISQRSDLPFY